eukprot:4759142-Prymnesium_polylepis.1
MHAAHVSRDALARSRCVPPHPPRERGAMRMVQHGRPLARPGSARRIAVFCYGSNGVDQLRERCQNPTLTAKAAHAPNHVLCFAGWSTRWQGAVATIVPQPGSTVYGSVVYLDDAALRLLDGFEGFNASNPQRGVYRREPIVCYLEESNTDPGAISYIKTDLTWRGEPSEAYLTACLRHITGVWPRHPQSLNVRDAAGRVAYAYPRQSGEQPQVGPPQMPAQASLPNSRPSGDAQHVTIFAYGSLLDPASARATCSSMRNHRPARVDAGWRRVFSLVGLNDIRRGRISPSARECAVLAIRQEAGAPALLGCIFEILQTDIAAYLERESRYRPEPISCVDLRTGSTIEAVTVVEQTDEGFRAALARSGKNYEHEVGRHYRGRLWGRPDILPRGPYLEACIQAAKTMDAANGSPLSCLDNLLRET